LDHCASFEEHGAQFPTRRNLLFLVTTKFPVVPASFFRNNLSNSGQRSSLTVLPILHDLAGSTEYRVVDPVNEQGANEIEQNTREHTLTNTHAIQETARDIELTSWLVQQANDD
jgi:hypothetical protein